MLLAFGTPTVNAPPQALPKYSMSCLSMCVLLGDLYDRVLFLGLQVASVEDM